MNLQINAVTLAVTDADRTKRFYVDGLGFHVEKAHGDFVALGHPTAPLTLGLYAGGGLATDAGVPATGHGFRRFVLSFIAKTPDDVDALVARAQAAGGELVKPAKRAIWGGYSAHVADPDGVLWKVASEKSPALFSERPSADGQKLIAAGQPIEPDEIAITLGAADIKAAKQFYEALGCAVQKDFGKFVSFSLGDGQPGFGLYTRDALANDAGVAPDGEGFSGVAFSWFVAEAATVDEIMARAVSAGGILVRPARKAEWGGYDGYFSDHEGQLWKVVSQA